MDTNALACAIIFLVILLPIWISGFFIAGDVERARQWRHRNHFHRY